MIKVVHSARVLLLVASATSVTACGPRVPETPGGFGQLTSAVVLVNPVINEGSTTTGATGPVREGVAISSEGGTNAETDETGLAVVQRFTTGEATLTFDSGSVELSGVQERELYDVVVSYTESGVQLILPPVRYPIASADITIVEAGGDIAAAASEDGAILLLEPGHFPGPIELRSEGVLIFGAWDPVDGPLSIIDGDVSVFGGNNRIRGVAVDGQITSAANGFSMAFSTVNGANITGNTVSLLRNEFIGGGVTVPSSSAVLVDNVGIP